MGRSIILVFVTACAAALAAGCGGMVLVDGESGGGGESGANGAGGEGGDIAVTTTTAAATTTGTDTVTIPPAQVTQACLDYCSAIDETTSCYSLEDCHARCMSFYLPGCTAEAESVLACLPEWLSDVCQIGYPDDLGGCSDAIDDLTFCGQQATGFCSYGYELVGSTACTGEMTCSGTDVAVACDATGKCSCTKEGMLVGGCAMPFAGAEACSPVYSCCQAFF